MAKPSNKTAHVGSLTVEISAHPSNLDPTAELVSGPREEISIFRVRGGFLACHRGLAIIDLFPSKDAARSAISGLYMVEAA